MYSYQLLPHTADTRLKLESSTLEGLFSVGLKGMASIMADTESKAGYEITARISIQAQNKTALLIDFLSEVLTLSHEKRVLFADVKFISFSENSIDAEITGRKVDGFKEDIKAVTYHEADIKKNRDDNWETTVVFDI